MWVVQLLIQLLLNSQAVYEASLARFVDDHRTIKDARLVVAVGSPKGDIDFVRS